MIVFLIQSLLLLAVAFVIGVIVGAMARMLIATDAPAPTSSASVSKPASVAAPEVAASPDSSSVSSVDKAAELPTEPKTSAKPAAAPPEAKSDEVQAPKPEAKKPKAAKPKAQSAKTAQAEAATKTEDDATPVAQETPSAEPDDLKKIKGIGPQNERKLNELGIKTYAQIAAWTGKDAEEWGDRLAFPGRIEREDWIAQAKALADAPPAAKPKRKRSPAAKPKKA